ncbi:universal stress protein [Paludibacterium denitrificans]|uniref:Universal stress protein n=1 Tax=Paludibacterium denitrificans TaxID=2675226 RepID=A0A844GEP3_9NEIS|nr:universal stress protein [Paludibacterium denitrificans]MTD33015.1 universal stress protein [Paludibacterium denitrificans]
MYQHIVVAVDGSHNADKALQQAILLAKQFNSQLTLAHIAGLRDLATEGIGLLSTSQLHELAFKEGRAILEAAEQEALRAGVTKVETHVGESWDGGKEMAEALIDFAQRQSADLIVLGTHGRKGLNHLLLGSFAENMLRLSRCPLLVIRNPSPDQEHQPTLPHL